MEGSIALMYVTSDKSSTCKVGSAKKAALVALAKCC